MTSPRPRIAILAAQESSASVLYGLYDVLMSVGAMYPDMTMASAGDALLDVSIVAAGREPFRCFGNILVEPAFALDEVDAVDVVVVADMYTPIRHPATRPLPARDRLAGPDARGGRARHLGVHRLGPARRVRPARRADVRQPLGIPRPVHRGVPAGPP